MEQSVQLGDMFSTRHQDSLYNPSITERGSPRVTRPDYQETYRSVNGPQFDFPEMVGTEKEKGKKKFSIKFQDDGAGLSEYHQAIKDGKTAQAGTIKLDPLCISCNNVQNDIIKQFKIACLAYAPSPVIFRNMEFSRSQIIVFRKFLMGQCSKIIHLKEPFKTMGMSTKRIFDDMYLFLKEVNMNYNKNINNIDEMNGLPA